MPSGLCTQNILSNQQFHFSMNRWGLSYNNGKLIPYQLEEAGLLRGRINYCKCTWKTGLEAVLSPSCYSEYQDWILRKKKGVDLFSSLFPEPTSKYRFSLRCSSLHPSTTPRGWQDNSAMEGACHTSLTTWVWSPDSRKEWDWFIQAFLGPLHTCHGTCVSVTTLIKFTQSPICQSVLRILLGCITT